MSNTLLPVAEPLENRNLGTRPFFMLLWKEIRRFWTVKAQTLISPLVQSTLYLLIFGVSLGKSVVMQNGLSYMEFLIPGLVMMSALNNAFQNGAGTIVNSKFHGDIQDLKIIPMSDYQIVFAIGLGGLLRGFAVSAVTLLTCETFYYVSFGKLLPIQNFPLFFVFLTIGSLAFAFLGVFTGFWAKGFEYVNAIGGFVLLPLLYLGGVFYSLETLHPFWQSVSKLNPLLYFVNGVRYGFLNVSDVSWQFSLLISTLAVGLFMGLALNRFRRGSFHRW